MMQQQQQPATIAPGNPIGYAPIYAPPPLATDAPATPTATPSNNGKRWLDGFLIGGLIGSAVFALATWGILDGLYSGADIRALQRAADTANASAINAEATAQQWQQHSQAQGQTLDGVREVLGCK